jgi:CRISPR-associated endonuclease Cas2
VTLVLGRLLRYRRESSAVARAAKAGEYLAHVQKSVFEGPLEEQRLEPMRRMLLEEIDPVTDTVRIFHLCSRCVPSTEIFGTGTFLDAEERDEVV